jgi:hypothetical protein
VFELDHTQVRPFDDPSTVGPSALPWATSNWRRWALLSSEHGSTPSSCNTKGLGPSDERAGVTGELGAGAGGGTWLPAQPAIPRNRTAPSATPAALTEHPPAKAPPAFAMVGIVLVSVTDSVTESQLWMVVAWFGPGRPHVPSISDGTDLAVETGPRWTL